MAGRQPLVLRFSVFVVVDSFSSAAPACEIVESFQGRILLYCLWTRKRSVFPPPPPYLSAIFNGTRNRLFFVSSSLAPGKQNLLLLLWTHYIPSFLTAPGGCACRGLPQKTKKNRRCGFPDVVLWRPKGIDAPVGDENGFGWNANCYFGYDWRGLNGQGWEVREDNTQYTLSLLNERAPCGGTAVAFE